MTKIYEVTYQDPAENWRWEYLRSRDYHGILRRALDRCPTDCRVIRIEEMPEHYSDKVKEN